MMDVLLRLRGQTFIAILIISALLIVGTWYSVLYKTYLDTSNPMLTHLPHHLSKTHYFASKSNLLNVYFLKQAWGWTTAAFFFSWFTSAPRIRTVHRVLKYLVLAFVWLLFTNWFFGPPIFERVTVASGGQCVIALPAGPITVGHEYCYNRLTINPKLFGIQQLGWKAVPRMRRGHDISGHVFLLSMSTLFLVDQLQPSLRVAKWSPLHRWAIIANIAMVAVWLFSIGMTSVYFHTPFEKLTGFLLGLASFLITQLPVFNPPSRSVPRRAQ